MRFFLAAVLSATCVLTGCASNPSTTAEQGKPAPVDENDSASLREATDIEGSTAVGTPITVQYERKPEYKRVPYLAVEFLPDGTAPLHDFKVTGTFPGSPRVIVVDDEFKILATRVSSTHVPSGSWESVTTLDEPHQGKVVVIVHDELWSKPMSFEVRATVSPTTK